MNRNLLIASAAAIALGGFAGTAGATTYYVSTSGSDNNSGTNPSAAFRSLQAGANAAQAGDTVYVMAGTYKNTDGGGSSIDPIAYIQNSGAPGKPITFSAFPGSRPKLYVQGSEGVMIGANNNNRAPAYIVIQGFEIVGKNPTITLSYALANLNSDATLRASCVLVDGMDVPAPYKPHHITVQNNVIHDCPGAGIATVQADYLTAQDNHIYNTALYSTDAQSGITMWQNWNSDYTTGTHNVIQRNIVNNNQELVPFSATGTITDGNGIIVDDSDNTQNGSTLGKYAGRTLIADNLVYNNGAYGITAYSSEHVDVVNNTLSGNATGGYVQGEFEAGAANDLNVVNNIFSAKANGTVTAQWSTSNTTYDYNVYYNAGSNSGVIAATGAHDLRTAPKWTPYYGLLGNSPAVASGTVFAAITTDLYRQPRAANTPYDRGAVSFVKLNGTYKLANASTNLALDVSGGASASGTPVVQTTAAGTPTQRWTIAGTADGYFTIVNAATNLALNSSSTSAGTVLTEATNSGQISQKFEMLPCGSGTFVVFTAANAQNALDGHLDGTASGSQVAQNRWNGAWAQEFVLTPG